MRVILVLVLLLLDVGVEARAAEPTIPAFCETLARSATIDVVAAHKMIGICPPTPRAPWCGWVLKRVNPPADVITAYKIQCAGVRMNELFRSMSAMTVFNATNGASLKSDNVNKVVTGTSDEQQAQSQTFSVSRSPALAMLSAGQVASIMSIASVAAPSLMASPTEPLKQDTSTVENTPQVGNNITADKLTNALAIASQLGSDQNENTALRARSVKAAIVQDQTNSQLKACRYRSNTMAAIAGLVTLARAVKISDMAKLGTLLVPIPFSECEKTPDAQLSPIAPIAPIAIEADSVSGSEIRIAEIGYSDSFIVTPNSSKDLIEIHGVVDSKTGTKKDLYKNIFSVAPTAAACNAVKKDVYGSVLVQDGYGQERIVLVTIHPAAKTCPA